ncbi:MAG: ROK family protein, partial [bacterium]|nr:ROK family protein [bacterium]
EGAGMLFGPDLKLPEKLVVLQEKMEQEDPLARKVYETVGTSLGYALAHYADFYDLNRVLILGRVTTGKGGDIMLAQAEQVLKADFPELADKIKISLPDEKSRRVGQSIAAASLPEIR